MNALIIAVYVLVAVSALITFGVFTHGYFGWAGVALYVAFLAGVVWWLR